jgi:NDP-sugar pyrophosphorylase family protein
MVTVFDKQAQAPGMKYIDYGLSVLSRKILDEIPDGKPYNLAHLYHRLAGEGRLAGYEVFQRFYEIGSPEGLDELRYKLAPHINYVRG